VRLNFASAWLVSWGVGVVNIPSGTSRRPHHVGLQALAELEVEPRVGHAPSSSPAV